MSEQSRTWRRSFAWGVLVVSDRDSSSPIPTTIGETGISASEAGIALRVRHAQDTDGGDVEPAQVTLEVSVDAEPPESAERYDLAVCSGVLVIGDADAMEHVAVAPGRWTASVSLDDPASAEVVQIWLTNQRA